MNTVSVEAIGNRPVETTDVLRRPTYPQTYGAVLSEFDPLPPQV